jgi:hypothetical protein
MSRCFLALLFVCFIRKAPGDPALQGGEEWCAFDLDQEEILQNWQKAEQGKQIDRIEPLK